MKTESIFAWHFVADTLRDGRPVPKDGELLVHPGRPIPCRQGLHASIEPYDAMTYAPGGTLCLVKCGGEIIHHENDKLVCTERTIIARMDANEVLRYFARMQALSVVHLWDPPDVVIDYLMAGDAAADAADAAHAAARAAYVNAVDATARAAYATARAAAARKQFNELVAECFEGVKRA